MRGEAPAVDQNRHCPIPYMAQRMSLLSARLPANKNKAREVIRQAEGYPLRAFAKQNTLEASLQGCQDPVVKRYIDRYLYG